MPAPVVRIVLFTHIVMFRFRPDVTEDEIEAVHQQLLELPGLVPEVRSFSVGRDAGVSEGNWDMVVVVGFDDDAGYLTYAAHPDHQPAIMAVRALTSERAGIQFQG
jgi:hypothetical protein